MTPKERAAMQQALDALESKLGETHPFAYDLEKAAAIRTLREALAEQAEQEPVAWIYEDELPEHYPYDDMYQSSKVINGVRMFPNVKVSDRSMFYALTKDHTWISVTETQFNKLKPECRMKCYAAPVRTKDLTDEEVWKIYGITGLGKGMALRFARAVIAADREKNKCQH